MLIRSRTYLDKNSGRLRRNIRIREGACALSRARGFRPRKLETRVATASLKQQGGLQVVFVTTEVAPWSKVGGLADVLAALPVAMASRGIRVMTVAPLYSDYEDVHPTNIEVPIDLPSTVDDAIGQETGQEHPTTANNCMSDRATLYSCVQNGVDRVFVSHAFLQGSIYGENTTYSEASEEKSNLDLRYSVLCQAALAAPVLLWEKSLSADKLVFVGNDWPTALLLLRLVHGIRFSRDGVALSEFSCMVRQYLANAACAYCIHNIAYQGIFPDRDFDRLCLPSGAREALSESVPWQQVHEPLVMGRQQPHRSRKGDLHGTAGIHTAVQSLSRVHEVPTVEPPMRIPLEKTGTMNYMRGALLSADVVLTVSPGYAAEVVDSETGMGCGMSDILRSKGVVGIMNGIDVVEWNPETDLFLPAEGRFSLRTVAHGKAYLKEVLQHTLGLDRDPHAVLFGFVGRLTEQKGVDVLMAAAPALLGRHFSTKRRQSVSLQGTSPSPPQESIPAIDEERDASHLCFSRNDFDDHESLHSGREGGQRGAAMQLAMLGTGEPWLEAALSGLSQSFPGRAAGANTFSEDLAHMIIAASDYVIVPSRFEPCGLVAQCAVRYGSVPIVTAVGGLKDLVTPDIGYTVPAFGLNPSVRQAENVAAFIEVVKCAAAAWGSAGYKAQQQRCMKKDVSWLGPAAQWEKVLKRIVD